MDRRDTKFAFHAKQLALILQEAAPFYNCLETKTSRSSSYQTLYYDTKDLSLYRQHHNGVLHRYKVRHRSYLNSGEGYLEVKFKNNKGRTIKSRIKEEAAQDIFDIKALKFLAGGLPFDPALLSPVVSVKYNRITLVNKNGNERITVDYHIEFEKGGQSTSMRNLMIAEVKQDKKIASPFAGIMRRHRIREAWMSKYCVAVAYMYPEVKKNNFKEKISSLTRFIA